MYLAAIPSSTYTRKTGRDQQSITHAVRQAHAHVSGMYLAAIPSNTYTRKTGRDQQNITRAVRQFHTHVSGMYLSRSRPAFVRQDHAHDDFLARVFITTCGIQCGPF